MTPTLATVLRTGGWCDITDVVWLAEQVARHCGEHRFVCLTDVERIPGVEVIPLVHGWPGWWSKIELFRPGLFTGPALYLDLDSVVRGDIAHMAGGPFAMVTDFYRPIRPQSCLMAWSNDAPTHIYADFAKNPQAYMDNHRRGGDQEYIATQVYPERLQERHPGEIVSWKVHCKDGVPEDARVVCFHGQPKWDDLTPQQQQMLAA